jgi:hypothetical protein
MSKATLGVTRFNSRLLLTFSYRFLNPKVELKPRLNFVLLASKDIHFIPSLSDYKYE